MSILQKLSESLWISLLPWEGGGLWSEQERWLNGETDGGCVSATRRACASVGWMPSGGWSSPQVHEWLFLATAVSLSQKAAKKKRQMSLFATVARLAHFIMCSIYCCPSMPALWAAAHLTHLPESAESGHADTWVRMWLFTAVWVERHLVYLRLAVVVVVVFLLLPFLLLTSTWWACEGRQLRPPRHLQCRSPRLQRLAPPPRPVHLLYTKRWPHRLLCPDK